MVKENFKSLLSKGNLMVMVMMAIMSFGLSSCDSSDDDPPQEDKATIKNNGTYTLERFRVVFLNVSNERLTDKDCGTMSPGDVVTVNIPTGATKYYMATYLWSTWFFSPNYDVTYKSLTITDAEIGNWTSN